MLTKHIVLMSPDDESVSIDKSSEDILLTKKAKEAYALIGKACYINMSYNILYIFTYIFKYS